MEARTFPNRPQRAPRGGQDTQKTEKEDRANINHPRLVQRRHVLSEKVANMAPRWLPKSKQHRRKIDAKIDRKSDASWNLFLEGFWWMFGGKLEACWHPNRANIDPNFEERFFEKSYSRCSGGSIFQVRGVQIGGQHRSKFKDKTRSEK